MDPYQYLLSKGYALLSRRLRSKKELTDALTKTAQKKRFNPSVVAEVISRFEDVGVINDEKFAQLWIETRSTGRGKGAYVLKRELKTKGISDELIAQTLDTQGVDSKEFQYTEAKKILEKKLEFWKDLPYLKKKKRSFDLLLRRGFSADIALVLVDELVKKA